MTHSAVTYRVSGHRSEIADSVLFATGVDVSASDAQRRTALQYATQNNRIVVARQPLDTDACPDGANSGNLTLLIMATDRHFTK